jgi:molybdate transport system substrate-binding protein
MRGLGVYDDVRPKLVLGENISQAAHFIESGAADIGIIALSLAIAPEMAARGDYWEIPAEAYPQMDQGGMVVKDSRHPDAAKALLDFILSSDARPVMERYGFILTDD